MIEIKIRHVTWSAVFLHFGIFPLTDLLRFDGNKLTFLCKVYILNCCSNYTYASLLLYPFVNLVPHQPRLDWQMWFAALTNYRNHPWLMNLVYRLLNQQTEG